MDVAGDIIHEDDKREARVYLTGTRYRGAVQNAALIMDTGSKWTATADSCIRLGCNIHDAQIDAPEGVAVTARGGRDGEYTLAPGGRLIITAQ